MCVCGVRVCCLCVCVWSSCQVPPRGELRTMPMHQEIKAEVKVGSELSDALRLMVFYKGVQYFGSYSIQHLL